MMNELNNQSSNNRSSTQKETLESRMVQNNETEVCAIVNVQKELTEVSSRLVTLTNAHDFSYCTKTYNSCMYCKTIKELSSKQIELLDLTKSYNTGVAKSYRKIELRNYTQECIYQSAIKRLDRNDLLDSLRVSLPSKYSGYFSVETTSKNLPTNLQEILTVDKNITISYIDVTENKTIALRCIIDIEDYDSRINPDIDHGQEVETILQKKDLGISDVTFYGRKY